MKKILFVCIHNSARSQMAEAFMNKLGQGKFTAESAGIEAGSLNPLVVQAMQEIGYDLSNNTTNSVFEYYKEGRSYSIVIKVCDQVQGERCPVFPKVLLNLNWNIEDPSALQGSDEQKLQKIRVIRDQIKDEVEEFIKQFSS